MNALKSEVFRNVSHSARIINGKIIASNILTNYKLKIEKLFAQHALKPCLAIIQIGNRSDSSIFIRNKIRVANSIGIETKYFNLDSKFDKHQLIDKIDELNEDKRVHGIITQLPFDTPLKFNLDEFVNRVLPSKDVDGLHEQNLSQLNRRNVDDAFVPCAARGCLELIKTTGVTLDGLRSVVVGSSILVGKPVAALLQRHNCLVTVCNKKTENLRDICNQADLLVVAIGNAQFIKGNFIKKGAVVIDVGINFDKNSNKIYGDVDFNEAVHRASHLTPVPGGVGPMTIAMLMVNTYESALRAINASSTD